MNARLFLALWLCLAVGAPPLRAEVPKPDAAHPHAHDPVLRAEHMDLLALLPDADITHTAVRDGAWSHKATWRDGKLPTEGANVLIPKGKTVTLDHVSAVALRAVRVGGALHFAPDRDTGLLVDTLIVVPEGSLIIGTAARPIAADRQATLTFADRGPIDTRRDPTLLGRGLIAHGTVSLHGAPVTSYVALASAPEREATRLTLPQRPAGWKVGDRLLLTGTALGRNQDEELQLRAIAGAEVTVSPVQSGRHLPVEGLSVYLANLSRNVVLRSQNVSDPTRAGHVMFMHSPNVTVANAAFLDLGRTDKRKPINDPKFDKEKKLLSGTGLNPRGRYAVHFHRTGVTGCADPVRVSGSVVVNSTGWGFVNHSSNVDFEDNIAFNVAGAAFVTEAGDEIGSFRRNLAVRSSGSGEDVVARTKLQDFGHEGDGFWLQGGGVAVEQNIAVGHASAGFILFTQGLEQEGLGRAAFKIANLPDRSLAPAMRAAETKFVPRDKDCVSVQQVPIRSFKDNVACACGVGIIVRFHLAPGHAPRSLLEGGVVWNCRTGAEILYSANVTLRKMRLVGNAREKTNTAIRGGNEGLGGLRYENLRVEGWDHGLMVPESGDHLIEGGFYNNVRSIVVSTRLQRDRSVAIRGIRFGTLPAEVLGDRPQYDVYLETCLSGFLSGGYSYRDPNMLFRADVVRYDDRQLYYPEQAADAVPLRRQTTPGEQKRLGIAAGSVPDELLDRTNRDLWERYGLALGGAVAPTDATTQPRIHGLVGKPATYLPPQDYWHPFQSSKLKDFTLRCIGRGKKVVLESKPADLRPGWNLVTVPVEGGRRSFLVFGGDMPAAGTKYGKPEKSKPNK